MLAIIVDDPDHSFDEDRFIIIGESRQQRLLVVSYTERGEIIRNISARLAAQKERLVYVEG